MIMSLFFSIVDDHIWFRNYQTSVPLNEPDKMVRGGIDKRTLVEVGPRFYLNPIKIFGGSFGGPTLYENPFYVSPNQIRALEKRQKGGGRLFNPYASYLVGLTQT